jgi:hypothetical protein
MSVNEKMTAIADAIREKTGDTEQLTLDDMATEIPKVYEAGKEQGTDEFWDIVQNFGNRTSYLRTFQYWANEYIRPKYKVVPTDSGDVLANAFTGCRNLKILESKYFDYSNLRVYPTSEYSGNYYTFQICSNLERIEDIGIPASYYSRTYFNLGKLKTIDAMYVREDTLIANAFHYDYELENLTVIGVIGQNGFDVSYSSKLTHDSLMSIINALKDYSEDTSGKTWLVTLGSANVAKLTEDELQIISDKGWNYK